MTNTDLRPHSAAYWRDVCRSFLRTGTVKRAAPSGGDSDSYELSFSNLAHAYLRDRAPQLMEFLLGFQLLEKSEDNDRAVGVFGFKVGPQLLYAPVFFINGELKGHELLYLKESDTFVPLKENWVNYILNRKPNVIGEQVPRNLREMGVEHPSMQIFSESPSKHASDQPDWLRPALPGLMYALGRYVSPGVHVPALLKESAEMASRFVRLLDAHPLLAKPITDCYGREMLLDAIDTAKTACSELHKGKKKKKKRRKQSVFKDVDDGVKDPLVTGELKIWTYDGTPKCREGLNEKQAEQLKRDGVYIKDDRYDTSKAYNLQEPMTLSNPDETGLYDILCSPDKFEKCLYIHGPHGPRGKKPNGVMVRVGDGDTKAWTETHPAAIFAIEQYDDSEYKKWFDALPDAGSLQQGGTYILLAPTGEGTSVFEVEKSLPSEGDEKCYEVWWRNKYARRPDHLPPVAERRYDHESDCTGADQVVINRIKGNKFVARLCNLYAPVGTKVLKLKGPPEPEKDDCCCAPTSCAYQDSSDPPALRPGSHVELQLQLYKTSSAMTVFNDGIEAIVDGSRMPVKAALITLVGRYGLREKAARDILKRAQLKRGFKCRIKLAQPYELMASAPSAPAFPEPLMATDTFMGSGLPMAMPQEEEIPIEGMQGMPNEPNMSAPVQGMPEMASQIQQAAQLGQKEVLDTSVMSNLLRGSQNETLIDRHLPNLMKGVDSKGRLLFNLYWHHDKFEDRYGSGALPELEDALKNSFEADGDVTLELKQKTIEPYPDEGVDAEFGEGER